MRAHDIIAVGTTSSDWTLPGWPEYGGLTVTSAHTGQQARTVRIDTTPPTILDLFLLRTAENRVERLPVLRAGSPLLTQLGLNAIMGPNEGFAFLGDENLQKMNIVYGMYDGESGLKVATFSMTEVTFAAGFQTWQRTLYGHMFLSALFPFVVLSRPADSRANSYLIRSGQWNPTIDPTPSSGTCSSSYVMPTQPGHDASCTAATPAGCSLIVPSLCYCTTWPTDNQCYVQYYTQNFLSDSTRIAGDPTSTGRFREGQFMYWHNFEFVLQLKVWNYALLNTVQDLCVLVLVACRLPCIIWSPLSVLRLC